MHSSQKDTVNTSQFSPGDWQKLIQFYSILIEIAQDMQKVRKTEAQKIMT